ncbi:UNVERIFIED_CONTAM: Long-chain-fatty-acid--CoA ligase 1 [Siphonaria sp. JEL0065]|nr:Long-chain-fatty-acid--CoA ligase 1 [Siphonaria sp. JEL0065]
MFSSLFPFSTTPPTTYSVEVDDGEPANPGEGKPRINAFAASVDPLPETSAANINSLHQNFLRGIEIGGDNPFLGTRPVTNGLAGPYIWQTYNEVYKRVRNLGSGLMSRFPPTKDDPPHIGIFALNRAEWIIVEQSCFMYSFVTIPLFDMYSHTSLIQIIHETQIRTVVATRDKAQFLLALCFDPDAFKDSGMGIVGGLVVGSGSRVDGKQSQFYGQEDGAEQQQSKEKKRGISGILKQIIVMDGADQETILLGLEVGITVVSMVDLEREGAKKFVPPFKPEGPGKDDIGTICYTSGTTGTPKGAILTHENMLSLLKSTTLLERLGRFSGLRQDDVYISYLPLAHVFERTMITCLIHAGARIGFFQGDTLKLMDDIAELSPTIFPSVPRLANRIYDKVKMDIIKNHNFLSNWLFQSGYQAKQQNLKHGVWKHAFWDVMAFSSVSGKLGGRIRLVLMGAAPINKNVLDFLRICFGCEVLEGYGLTETCSTLTVASRKQTDRYDCTADQVGAPVPGVTVKLIDVPEMNYSSSPNHNDSNGPIYTPAPPQGEILVKGSNVFHGYYKNPTETDKVLDNEGWFHTGDVGEWDPQGRLRIIDRKKSIFKLSQGEYIAPEKIEGILKRNELVSQAFVYGDSLKPCIIGIIVPDRNAFMHWATKKQGMYHKNFKDLCLDDGIRKAFHKAMEEHGKTNGLKGFENIKAVYLESDANAFTIENGLLTPIFKLKRFEARMRYEREILDMYSLLRM